MQWPRHSNMTQRKSISYESSERNEMSHIGECQSKENNQKKRECRESNWYGVCRDMRSPSLRGEMR
jgi:hypothetical protein